MVIHLFMLRFTYIRICTYVYRLSRIVDLSVRTNRSAGTVSIKLCSMPTKSRLLDLDRFTLLVYYNLKLCDGL